MIREHPYPVIIEAGKVETDVVRMMGEAERLLYIHTPEAVKKVEENINGRLPDMEAAVEQVEDRFLTDPPSANRLKALHYQVKENQAGLIALAYDQSKTTEDIAAYESAYIMPQLEEMRYLTGVIIQKASGTFENFYITADWSHMVLVDKHAVMIPYPFVHGGHRWAAVVVHPEEHLHERCKMIIPNLNCRPYASVKTEIRDCEILSKLPLPCRSLLCR